MMLIKLFVQCFTYRIRFEIAFRIKYIFFVSAFLLTKIYTGQCNDKFSLECIENEFEKSNLFIFGEQHWRCHLTSRYQLELVDKLYLNGVKEITIFFEIPHFMLSDLNNFFYSTDSVKIKYETTNNFKCLLEGLKKYKEGIKFNFVSFDLTYGNTKIEWFKTFIEESFIVDLFDSNEYKIFEVPRLNNIRRINRIIKEEVSNPEFYSHYSKVIKLEYQSYFFKELENIHSNRLWNPIYFDNKKSTKKREDFMARTISEIYTDSLFYIATIGKSHISNQKNSNISYLVEKMDSIARDKVIVMPIVYPNYQFVFYEGDFLKGSKSDFNKLIEQKIYDYILMPQDTVGDSSN